MTVDDAQVLLTATMLRPEERSLLEALRREGISVAPALMEDVAMVVDGQMMRPDLALIRNVSHREAISVARRLEYVGVPTLNRASAIEICNDKGVQALLFRRQGVPHPFSYHAFSCSQVEAAAVKLGWPVVVKPVSSSWGRGVTLLRDHACLEAWVSGRESADPASKLFPVIVQEYVEKPGHDLRVVVIGDVPVVAFRRVSGDWRTNTHIGARVEPAELTDDIRKISAEVVDLLGEGFYGIDLLTDVFTDRLMVLEVNANPEFARSSAQHGVDVARALASYLAGQLRAGSLAGSA